MAKSRSVEIPQDFLLALETKDGLAAFFLQYPPSHQNETFKWINEAKKPQTRTSRIEKAVKMLWEKKKKSGE
ncbi:MAG TPA: YdeI/OmpD-associated family protein [Phycisphaerae bacterium]|nr:YdeI/OmpD-associated family protein [Phycisphaerae bacterium]